MMWHTSIDSNFCDRLCQTLMHSLWQAALLALLVWLVERLWRSRTVEQCYAMHVAALLAVLAALPITYSLIDGQHRSKAIVEADRRDTVAESESIPLTSSPIVAENVIPFTTQRTARQAMGVGHTLTLADRDGLQTERPAASSSSWWLLVAPWIAVLYVAGVVVMLMRVLVSIIAAKRLCTRADLVTAGPLVDALRAIARRWSITVVPALARADQIVVPKVVGLVRPMILLPTSAISGLTSNELEMILSHELAHVRRHDMWVNLVQRLAESALFFNPALWYLSRRINTLREYCCDDMTCQSQPAAAPEVRVRYATALLRVVELAKPNTTDVSELASLAASGRSPSEIRRRVARLFGEPLREPLRISRSGALMLIILAASLTLGPSVWESRAEAPDEPTKSKTNTATEDEDTPFEFHLKIVGPDGKPVANANIEIRTRSVPTAQQIAVGSFVRASSSRLFVQANEAGLLVIELPEKPTLFNLSIKQAGFGPYWAGWNSTSDLQVIPRGFTAKLEAGWAIGGVVADSDGIPIEGVKVRPRVYYKKRPGDFEQLGVGTRTVTDSEGVWRFNSVPDSRTDVHVEISHADYQPLQRRLSRSEFEVRQGVTPTGHIDLKRGLTVTGTVTDESGDPIVGALVRTKFLNDIREARTDEWGVYDLVGCEPRMARIVVSAKGRAIDMQEVRVDPDLKPVDFTMKPGGKIRVRVVDEQGNGIPNARIFFQRWRGRFKYFEFDHVSQRADENGVWEWSEAPLDEFKADICRPGGMQLNRQSLVARDEEYVFTPPKALIVSGSVVDAQTQEPIQTFRVIPGLRNIDPLIRFNWIPSDSYDAKNGEYRIRMTHSYPAHLVRIEAEGYKVAISRDIMTNEGEVHFDFELQPAEDIAGTILTSEGQPASRAKIALGVAGSQITVERGDIDDGSTSATQLNADADGRFSIPARDEPFQIVITHPSGFAHLKSTDGPVPDRITLTAWARAEGTFRVGEHPAPGVVLSLSSGGIHSYGDEVPNIHTHHNVTTGVNGRFIFERVFPGKRRIGRRILLLVEDGAAEVTSSQRVFAEFVAGKTTTIDLGGTGRPVIGKLAAPAEHSERVLWNFALVEVGADPKAPPSPSAPENVRNDPELRKAWWDAWKATEVGKAWSPAYEAYERQKLTSPYITATVDRDGSFRIDDMPEGRYKLMVRFSKNAPGFLVGYRFYVPAVEEGRTDDIVDLGILTLGE